MVKMLIPIVSIITNSKIYFLLLNNYFTKERKIPKVPVPSILEFISYVLETLFCWCNYN